MTERGRRHSVRPNYQPAWQGRRSVKRLVSLPATCLSFS